MFSEKLEYDNRAAQHVAHSQVAILISHGPFVALCVLICLLALLALRSRSAGRPCGMPQFRYNTSRENNERHWTSGGRRYVLPPFSQSRYKFWTYSGRHLSMAAAASCCNNNNAFHVRQSTRSTCYHQTQAKAVSGAPTNAQLPFNLFSALPHNRTAMLHGRKAQDDTASVK